MPLLIAFGLGAAVAGYVAFQVSDAAENVAEATGNVGTAVLIGGAAGVAGFFVIRKVCG